MHEANAPNPETLKKKLVFGVGVVLGKGIIRWPVSLISAAILARLLSPADYGLFGLVIGVQALVHSLGELGLSAAAVHKPDLTLEQSSGLFWINTGLGFSLWLLLSGISPFIAWSYNQPILIPLIIVTSSGFAISGTGVQHRALLARRLDFFRLSLIDLSAFAVGTTVSLTLAWLGFGVWALAFQGLALSLVNTGGLWVFSGWRPSRFTRRAGLRSLLSFGGYLTGARLVGSLVYSLDNLLLGFFAPVAQLGQYTRAKFISALPESLISNPVGSVTFPYLSKLQAEPVKLAQHYHRLLRLSLCGPFFAGLLFIPLGPDIVRILYGPQWDFAGELLSFLGLAAASRVLHSRTATLYLAIGHTDKWFKLNALIPWAALSAMALGSQYGTATMVWAYSLCLAMAHTIGLLLALRNLKISMQEQLSSLVNAVIPLIVGLATAIITKIALSNISTHIILSVIIVTAAGFTGSIFMITLCSQIIKADIRALWWQVRNVA